MAETAIEWATHVWNPVTGCDRVSPGCANCYALTYAGRLKAMGQPKYQRDGGRASGPGFGVTMHEDELAAPARWRKPRRVFVNSMSDLFHEEVTEEFIARVFTVMAAAPQHDFLVLTKRAERMRDLVRGLSWDVLDGVRGAATIHNPGYGIPAEPLPNVWLGVSIENRRFVGRADLLRQTPAAVRFISAEPLLGPLALSEVERWRYPEPPAALDLTRIDWLIVGGESGNHEAKAPHRFLVDADGLPRADRRAWVRDLRDACADSGASFFFKQWGGRTPKASGRELDGRTWDQFPTTASVARV